MQASGDDGGDLEAQLACKEREWKELQSLRVQQLESSLRDAQEQFSLLRPRFQQLREDFRFNLAVLEERDRELERYDAMAARAQVTETARQEEMSQLRIQIAKLQEEREREARERGEDQRRNQQRAAEHRLQMERLQSSKTGDIQKQREEYEGMKRDLQCRIQEVEGELALQRQEMMADFDNNLRQREHEFNLRTDEMRVVVLSHELQVKLLSKETEVHSQAQTQAVEALKASEELCQHTHTQLRRRDWEIKDITAVKDSRIKELEDKLRMIDIKRKKEEETYNKKHEELDRAVRERDGQLEALREAHGEQLRQVEKHTAGLQAQLDTMAAQIRRTQKDHEDTLTHRDQQIERLRTELETTRSSWDTHITQVSKETVAKDTELLALQEREAKLRTDLERSRGETERYKQQLCAGVEREKALEQRRVQVELDWQRRCEDAKAQHYLHSEGLIQGLTQARDQAAAELRERDRDLQDMTALLRTVTMERDQALQGSRPGGEGGGGLASEEIRRVQQQNSSLRVVVAQMRRDMESLIQPSPPAPPDASTTQQPTGPLATAQPGDSSSKTSPAAVGTAEFTQALEQEVTELKARCRRLEEQLEGATRPHNTATVTPATTHAPVAPDNAYLQNHIRSLNETIGGLRVEKVATTAALRKQEVRVAHLESALATLTQQCHSKQLEGEELRLELANHKRSWLSEEAGLRQRLAAVEMELEEVRREKEEYQKGSILNNLETVALGNQVSALKLDIASGREPIVCEESEMVRQLQEENLCLRRQQQQLASGLRLGGTGGQGGQGGKLSAPPLLQAKLKQAARCIARLTRDRQQLIEMGNRLRAQLTHAGLDVPQAAPEPSLASELVVPERDPSRDQQGRLSALERLQYQLTTQELQYAQREQRRGAPAVVSESESGGRDRHGAANPWGQGHKDTHRHERSRSKENTPPLLSQSQASLQLDGGARPSCSPSGPLLSSVTTEGSLREVWQILDRGLSPSILTPRHSTERDEVEPTRQDLSETSPEGLRLQGSRAPVQERRKPTRPASETARKTKTAGRGCKIRNYNMKD